VTKTVRDNKILGFFSPGCDFGREERGGLGGVGGLGGLGGFGGFEDAYWDRGGVKERDRVMFWEVKEQD